MAILPRNRSASRSPVKRSWFAPTPGRFTTGTNAFKTEGNWIRCCSRSIPPRFGLSVPAKSTCRATTWSAPVFELLPW